MNRNKCHTFNDSGLRNRGIYSRMRVLRSKMVRKLEQLCCLLMVMVGVVSCYPPPVQYPYTQLVTERRAMLKEHLLALLPAEERGQFAAHEEATWLADTAYKASAGIARINGSFFPGWAGNALINARMQDRGLCWHYQHDLYRELRRRPLHYFRLGCCVRDAGKASEHNCLYVAPKKAAWPHAWVLDAWMWNGRLKVDDARKLNPDRWSDLPSICRVQSIYYQEGHLWPIEHWSVLRGADGNYEGYWLPEMRYSAQYRRMYRNIEEGKQQHPGLLTNY